MPINERHVKEFVCDSCSRCEFIDKNADEMPAGWLYNEVNGSKIAACSVGCMAIAVLRACNISYDYSDHKFYELPHDVTAMKEAEKVLSQKAK